MTQFHKDAPIGDIHIINQWSYGDATARAAASGFLSSDVGKVALQEDTKTYWVLTAYSPITWRRLTFADEVTWTKYDFTYSQFSAAALTNDIEAFQLPIKGILEDIVIKHSTAFVGTGVTDLKAQVGLATSLNKYIAAFDMDSAVADTNFDVQKLVGEIRSFASATSIRVGLTAVGANLNQLTAGAFSIWVRSSTLP